MMFTFSQRPHLMASFESFVVNFGIARELRSLDSEVKIYTLQTLLPEIITKEYETLPLEAISYQGAYIRTVTLIILEGMINKVLTALADRQQNP